MHGHVGINMDGCFAGLSWQSSSKYVEDMRCYYPHPDCIPPTLIYHQQTYNTHTHNTSSPPTWSPLTLQSYASNSLRPCSTTHKHETITVRKITLLNKHTDVLVQTQLDSTPHHQS